MRRHRNRRRPDTILDSIFFYKSRLRVIKNLLNLTQVFFVSFDAIVVSKISTPYFRESFIPFDIDMLIKQCTNRDLAKISEIFNEYRVHFGEPSDLIASTAFLEERLLKNQAVIFAATEEESEEIMGFTLLYPMFSSLKTKSTWTLNDMYIAEKYRKFGVATQLLEKVKEFGAETDAQWITLKTGNENVKAQALYEKFGFKKDEGHFYYYLQ